jgi:hypothetical protein
VGSARFDKETYKWGIGKMWRLLALSAQDLSPFKRPLFIGAVLAGHMCNLIGKSLATFGKGTP